jgi:hypothetical protein
MIQDLGTVRPGTTLYIPFHTFDSNDPSASVTLTGLAVTDIEIYKDGSTTQRASDNGYALLDTDGIDFDGVTGIHGISINLADNSTAGFYAAGSQYWVVISSVTVDAATINFVLATFRIGYEDAIINTTIASLSSQTSFTLTNGPAEDDALNGCLVCIHDVASGVQLGFAVILDYTGSTKTVTLAAGVTFTAAATDNISIFAPVAAAVNLAVVAAYLDTEIAAIKAKTDNLPTDPADASDIASSFSTVNTKLDTIDDFLDTEVAAIKAKTDNLPSDPADASDIAGAFSTVNTTLGTIGGYLDTEIAAIKAKTDNLPSDPADASVVAGLIAAVETKVDTLDTVADAIKVTTDKLDDTLEDQGGGVYGFTEPALQEAPSGGGGSSDWDADERTAIRSILGIPASGTTPDDPTTGILDTIRDNAVAIKAKTDNLPSDPADASVVAGLIAGVETKVDTIDDFLDTEVAAIKAKTDNLPSDPADASVVAGLIAGVDAKVDIVDGVVDSIKAKTDNLPSDPADASVVAGQITAAVAPLATAVNLATVDTVVDAIKVKTDEMSFTDGNLDSNIKAVNDTTVQGDGGTGTEWGP